VVFFSEVFDAMFRLCADSETNVQNAVQFLDNLVKVRPATEGCEVQL
jgi:vacuole morphology and inheritance protein 14